MAGSNNYLGLAYDERVREAAIKAVEKYGSSCSGSRFMNGSLLLHEELETKIGRLYGPRGRVDLYDGVSNQFGGHFGAVGQKRPRGNR